MMLTFGWMLSGCERNTHKHARLSQTLLVPRAPPPPLLSLSAIVDGLTNGAVLVLQVNGARSTLVTTDGAYTLVASQPTGMPYVVSVPYQPSGHVCTLAHGSGRVFSGMLPVTVSCARATQLGNDLEARQSIGQPSSSSNQAAVPPNASTLLRPWGKTYTNDLGVVYVADRGNHRVLGYYPAGTLTGQTARFVLGQSNDFTTSSAGLAPDTFNEPCSVQGSGDTLVVTDCGNHRVLIYASMPEGQAAADVVVGQSDFMSNATGCSPNQLNTPTSAIMVEGRLVIADAGNARVLIYNAVPTTNAAAADIVLGQASMTACAANRGGMAATNTLDAPQDAWSDGTRLFVTDLGNHRLLGWKYIPLFSGETADIVVGQPDMTTVAALGPSAGSIASPMYVTADAQTLFVSDMAAHRVMAYRPVPIHAGQAASYSLGQMKLTTGACNRGLGSPTSESLCGPTGVSYIGGSLVVTDTSNHRLEVYNSDPNAAIDAIGYFLVNVSPAAGPIDANIVAAGGAAHISITAMNVDGTQNSSYVGSVGLMSSDPNAALAANITLSSANQGILVLNGAFFTAGQQNIVVTDTRRAKQVGQGSFVVVPGDANYISVSGYPSPVMVGQANTFAITMYDAYHNIATNYAGAVVITSNDGSATLPSPIAFDANMMGVASATLTFGQVGLSSITAADAHLPQVTGTEPNILVTSSAGPAVSYTFSGYSTPIAAGQQGNVTLTARDANGAVALGYAGTAVFTSTDPNAILPGPTLFGQSNQGVVHLLWTFATSGNQTVTATDANHVLLAGTSGSIAVQGGNAVSLMAFNYPSVTVAGQSHNITLRAIDAYGNIATNYTGLVFTSITDLYAVASPNYQFSPSDDGNAAFPIAFETVGTWQVTIQDQNTPSLLGQQNQIVVHAGPAAFFLIGHVPSPQTAGSNQNVFISPRDAYDNLADSYHGTVVFSSTDPCASLPASLSFANGMQTSFPSLAFHTAGSWALSVNDTVTPAISAMLNNIVVTAGAAASIGVSAYPSPMVAGQVGNVTLMPYDAFGNLVTTYSGTVQITSSDALAVLPANVTFDSSSSGVAHAQLTLKTSGLQTIDANDSTHLAVAGNQNHIQVNPNVAVRLQLQGFANISNAGQAGNITVSAIDAYNNIATGYTRTVHFTSTDPNAILPSDTPFASGDMGVKVLSLTMMTVGMQSIDANDTVTASIAGAQNTQVVGGHSAAYFVVENYPTPVTAGQSANVSIWAYDAYGNLATGYTGTVHLTSTDAHAFVQSDLTFTAGFAGMANMTVMFTTSGLQAINANDVSLASIAGREPNILVNPNVATILQVGGFPSPSNAGAAGNVTLTALDAYGNIATGYTGQVAVTTSDPCALVPGNYTFNSSAAGVHSLPVTFLTAGNQNIYVADTATPALAGAQRGIVIQSGVLDHFSVSGFATPAIAGAQGNVTVAARDIYNNLIVGYTGTLHLSSSDPCAALPADLAYVAANAGTAQLPVTLKTAGTWAINANDLGTPSISGQQNSILAGPGPATHFKVSAYPTTVTAGQQDNVHIAAYDDYNNLATGYTGTVHVSSTDGNAALPSDLTYTSASADLPVQLLTAGTQAINANDSATPSIAGNENFITVNPNVVDHLVARTFPNPSMAGAQGNIIVVAYDIYNNIATGYAGTVHVTSADPNAIKPSDYIFAGASAGTVQLPVTLRTVGNQNIVITDTATATLTATQANIQVNSGSVTHYAVSGYPAAATAGQQGNTTFVALDNYNNVVTGYTGTLHLSSTDVAAILPYDFAFRASDAGVLTMPVTLATTGNQAIVGTDYDAPAITGMQNFIVISPNVATRITLSGYPGTAVAGAQGNLTVTMRDAYANVATGFAGAVNFTSDDPLATYPASTTFAGGDAGMRTIALAFGTNGNHVLDANGAVNPNVAGQLPIVVVSPNSVTHLLVQNYPASVTAGQQANVTLFAVDNFNNVVFSYTGTVQISSTDPNAGLPSSYTFVAANQGNVSLPVTLQTSGTWAISANDTGSPAISGIQGGIVVSPNAATRFVLTGLPSASVAGNANLLTVTAFDNYNNVATTFSDVVALSSSDANAALGPASGLTYGVGTFSVSFYTAGTQWLNANDVGNPNLAARQSGIVVSPAGAAALLATAFPTTSTACQGANIIITAVDNFNNVVPNYTGTVTLTSSDAAAALPGPAAFTAGNAGVRPLTLTLKTPGAQSITATDGGGLSVTDTNILVLAGSPNVVVLVAPPSVQPTQKFGAVVSVYDNCNNLSIGYTGTINLTSTDSSGTPSSTAVPVVFGAADAGVKTVTNLQFKTVTAARALSANDAFAPSQISGQTSVAVAAQPFYADWDYTSATQASYIYDANKIDFTPGYAELKPINTQVGDNNSASFGAGTAVNVRWDSGVSAMVLGNSNPNVPALLYAGGEPFDPAYTSNTVVYASGTFTSITGSGTPTLGTYGSYYSETPYSGSLAYVMQANQTVNSNSSQLYMKLIDMSGKNFILDANSQLTYQFFPSGPNTYDVTAGNSNYMVLYVQFTDGTSTANGSYVDINNRALTPAAQGGNAISNVWNRVVVDLGSQGLNGKTVDHIGGYWNRTNFTGGFQGWFDEILLTGVVNNAQTNTAGLAPDWTPQYGSLIAYYPFDGNGTVNDGGNVAAGIGAALVAHNSDGKGLRYVASHVNTGLYFDGNDDYLTLPVSGFPNSSSMSVGGWVNVTLNPSYPCGRLWEFGSSSSNNIGLVSLCANSSASVAQGTLYLGSNGAFYHTDVVQAPAGSWIHWMITYDGTTGTTYLNGQKSASNALNVALSTILGSNNYFGNDHSGNYFRGMLDEWAVWNTVLSPNDVGVIFDRQAAAYSGSLTSRVMTSPYQTVGTQSMGWKTNYPASKPLPSDAVSERSDSYASNGNDLSSGLEYLWHFDETALGTVYGGDFLDDTGHGNVATLSPSNSQIAPTMLGQDGILDRSIVSNGNMITTSTYLINPQVFTLSIWFKTVYAGGKLIGFGSSQTGYSNIYDRHIYVGPDGQVVFGINGSGGLQVVAASGRYHDGHWHHAAATLAPSGVGAFYMDGKFQGSTNGGAQSYNGYWHIGADSLGGWPDVYYQEYFGALDEVAIWNRVLSANEILELYRRGATRFKYRLRTCANSSCSDNQAWQGPDGTPMTYFSELRNTSGTNSQNAWSPNLQLTNYPALSINANQGYIQYQGVWGSDDINKMCAYNSSSGPCSAENTNIVFNRINYDTTSPSVTNANTVSYYDLTSFAMNLGSSGCLGGVTYTMSPDNTTYYYYTGTAWASSNGTLSQTSTAAQLTPANLSTYSSNYGIGKTYFRAYLTSSGTTPCSLQSIALGGSQ